jgi:hypothetical protein
MRSLVGRAVTVYLAEENPPLRLEGRIDDARDDLLEVRLARRELSSLKTVLHRTLRVEVEYVEGREVWGMPCRLETYGTAFPPVLVLKPVGTSRVVHRRRHERHATNLPVKVILGPGLEAPKPAGPEEWEDGRLVNLSQGGAAVMLRPELAEAYPSPCALGSNVQLQFVVTELVKPRARVVRREEAPDTLVLGFEFAPLSTHDDTVLNGYLRRLNLVETARPFKS